MNMPTPEHQTYIPASAGAQLRAYRENAQLTVDDVAHQLKLARRQVLAIENDELDALPGPTFVRGFIRNYARLLRVDPAPILEATNLAPPAGAAMERIAPTMGELPANHSASGSWTRWLIPVGLVLVLVAGIGFYEFGGVGSGLRKARKDVPDAIAPVTAPAAGTDQPVTAPAPPAGSTTAPGAGTVPGTGNAGTGMTPSPAVPSSSAASAAGAAGSAPAAQPPAAEPGRVELQLSAPAWIEIRDARDAILVSRTLPAGEAHSFSGEAPLSLKIGNARAVRLKFNGTPVELAPWSQREIARLTLPLARP
jgi:cytoskeleton protein RodZ